MYVVIMAGGGGTRLHPLSRPERPKPFLPLLGHETLLQRTAARLLADGDLGLQSDDVTVVTDRRYATLVRDQLPDTHILVEPMGRNTAAAIALAVAAIDRPSDEVMLVVPADHTIEREAAFRAVIAGAAETLADGVLGIEDPLVTLGIAPDRAATEYGYLLPDLDRGETTGGLTAWPLAGFEEKPTESRARELVRTGGAAWNAGIFLWRRRAIRAALERYTSLVQMIEPVHQSASALETAYDRIRSVSIDHAVMEGAARDGRVVMTALDVGWSDLGTWTALLAAIGAVGTGVVVQTGETITVDADDLVVRRIDGRLGTVAPAGSGSMTAAQTIAVLRDARGGAAAIDALLERCSDQEA
jgi:mannose-1-phosphate guanylyltransferase